MRKKPLSTLYLADEKTKVQKNKIICPESLSVRVLKSGQSGLSIHSVSHLSHLSWEKKM